MKISKLEIEAALLGFYSGGSRYNSAFKADMRRALEAALKVRRARKQAKRERQRKEKDKHVVESVKPVFGKLDGDCFASAFDAAMKPKA